MNNNFNIVLNAIQHACNANVPALQQSAMQELQNYESTPGFVTSLVQILQSPNLHFDCKFLSLICLKNSVNRNWISRDSRRVCVSPEEKLLLREFVMSLMGETSNKLFIQHTVLIGKIAKHDWPQEWPTLFDSLFSLLSNPNPSVCINSMRTMLHVLEILKSKTLASSKAKFNSVCIEIFSPMKKIWIDLTSQWYSMLSNSLAHDTSYLETFGGHILSCTGIIKLLAIQNFLMIDSNSTAKEQVSTFLSELPGILDSFSRLVLSILSGSSVNSSFTPQLLSSASMLLVSGGWWENHGKCGIGVDDEFSYDESTEIWSCSVLADVDLDNTLRVSSMFATVTAEIVVPALVTSRIISEISSIPRAIQLKKAESRSYASSDGESMEISLCQFFPMFYSLTKHICYLPTISPLVLSQHESLQESTNVPLTDPYIIELVLYLSKVISDVKSVSFLESVLPTTFSSSGTNTTTELFDMLIYRLLSPPPSWLTMWSSNPEEFFQSIQASSESDSVRCASEGLFSSLLHWAPDAVCSMLWNLLQDFSRQASLPERFASLIANRSDVANIITEILLWESVYTCCSFCSYQIGERGYDIIAWMSNAIAPLLNNMMNLFQMSNQYPIQYIKYFQILCYRVVWMLSCWAYTIDSNMLGGLISTLVNIMNYPKHVDLIVRLQSVKTLGVVLQVNNFDASMLYPCIESLLMSGCVMIRDELEDNESKNIIIELFVQILVSCHANIRPFLLTLCQYMGQLWGNSNEDEDENNGNIVRTSILRLFTQSVKIVGSEGIPDSMLAVILPIVAHATSASEDTIHLISEGIELWLTVVRNCIQYTDYLNDILQRNLPRILDGDLIGANFDEMKNVQCLLEAYFVLGGINVIRGATEAVSKLLVKSCGNIRPRAVPYAMRPLDALLVTGSVSSSIGYCVQFLRECDIIKIVIRACAASLFDVTVPMSVDQSNPTQQRVLTSLAQLFKPYQEADVAIIAYLGVVSRLIVCFPDEIFQTAENLIVSTGGTSYQNTGFLLVKGICRLMIDKFDSFGYAPSGYWKRRICAVSLLSLYPTSDIDLIAWMPEIFYIIDNILTETNSTEGKQKLQHLSSIILAVTEDDADPLNDYEVNDNLVTVKEKEPICHVFERVLNVDPVLCTDIYSLLMEKCDKMKNLIGDQRFMNEIFLQVEEYTRDRLIRNSYNEN